jgi:hypothetical protein
VPSWGRSPRSRWRRLAVTRSRVLLTGLSLRFNQEEFCDGLYPYRKTLAFSIFADSGSLFERRVAFRPAREAAFGSAGRSAAGFRWLRRRARVCQNHRNGVMDSDRRKVPHLVAALPLKPQVRNARPSQPELRESGHHTTHVHRSACSGWRTLGVVHPMLCLRKRKVYAPGQSA